MNELLMTRRIRLLKEKMLSEPRYASIEQARIITETYKANEEKPRIIQRALSLKAALEQMKICAEPEELIVGNRTAGVRWGVVFPESGSTWVDREFETLPTRPQDRFQVRQEDITYFRQVIKPYWAGQVPGGCAAQPLRQRDRPHRKGSEDQPEGPCPGPHLSECKEWLQKGPAGLKEEAESRLQTAKGGQKEFYESVALVMSGAIHFMERYHDLLMEMAGRETEKQKRSELEETAKVCRRISKEPPKTFREAVQSIWFLFVILHMDPTPPPSHRAGW